MDFRRSKDDLGGQPGCVRYAVRGPRGAVVMTFLDYRRVAPNLPADSLVMAADFAFHSLEPREGGGELHAECDVLGGARCFYAPSPLVAQQYTPLFAADDDEAIYRVLELAYLSEVEPEE